MSEGGVATRAVDEQAPEVSVVVVSFNTRDMTVEALESLVAQTRAPMEIIVVDNASTDGSAEAISQRFPGVRLIDPGRNMGFAAANNLAAQHARGRYLLLLNPDTVVLDAAVDRLLAFAQARPQAKIWGGRTFFDRERARLNPTSCWRRMTLWSLLMDALGLRRALPRSMITNPEAFGSWRRDTVREVDIVSGCFFLIEREFWERLGGFDPAFFMYGEEADLCLRAKAMGARPAITPDATIVHYGGASETVRVEKRIRLFKAKALLIRRHFPRWQRRVAIVLLSARPCLQGAALSVFAPLLPSGVRTRASVWREVWRRRGEWLAREEAPQVAPAPAAEGVSA